MPSGNAIQDWLKPISKFDEAQSQPQQPQQSQQPQQPQQPQQQPQMQQDEQGGGTLDFLSITIDTLNTNPYFIGMLMLMLNLGGRFLASELTPKQEEFLQKRWLRPLLFFIVIFVATRNIAVAFWMTMGLFMVLWILANEQSPFCIIPSWKPFENPEEKSSIYESNMHIIEQLHAINH